MGEYTTNYLLYMPSVGEQGWGDLVNANFTKLDTILKSGAGIRSAQADELTTARTINGTSFNGTANITTTNWGTARNITITDGTNTGTVTSVNGSESVSLKLPTTIKASINGTVTGTATQANKLMQYVPSDTQISSIGSGWTASYSGTVKIYNSASAQYNANIQCNGIDYIGILPTRTVTMCVTAGARYTNTGMISGNAIYVYGTAAYR